MKKRLVSLATLLAAVAAFAGMAPTQAAGVLPRTQYYFHSGGVPVNQLDSATFDTSKPTSGTPSVASATRALGNGPPGAWTGNINGTIDSIKVDFWQEAPVAEVEVGGTVDYDVSLVVGSTTYPLPLLTVKTQATDVPAEVTGLFVGGTTGVPLPLNVAGNITIQIRGHFDDSEAGSLIVYDSTNYPSGFSINDVPARKVVKAPVVPSVFGQYSSSTVAPRCSGCTEAGEPSIAVGPEGNLYVSWPGDAVNFSRSTDGGRTWTAGAVATTNPGDTTVNVDPTGAVYESNLQNIEPDTNTLEATLFKSFDHGTTWAQRAHNGSADNASNQPLRIDRQWVDVYLPHGKPTSQARVYVGYHDFAISSIWVNTSTDGGKTFGPPVNVINDTEARADALCSAFPIGLRVAQAGPHAGRIYMAWSSTDAPSTIATACDQAGQADNHILWIAWSDDGGSTWTDHKVFSGPTFTETGVAIPDLTLDRVGNPYVAFGDNLASVGGTNQWDIYVEASFDGGTTWNGRSDGAGEPYRVTTDKGTHFFAAIAAGDPGKVDVAYIATDVQVAETPTGKPAPLGNLFEPNALWRVYMAQSLNLLSGKPQWTIHAVTKDPIHQGDVCTSGIFCSAGEVVGLANRHLLDFIDVAVDANGMAHIAYTDDYNESATLPGTIRVGNQFSGPSVFAASRRPVTSPPAVLGERAARPTLPATGLNDSTGLPIALLVAAAGVLAWLRPRLRRAP